MAVTTFFLAGCLLAAPGETARKQASDAAAARRAPKPATAQPSGDFKPHRWRSPNRSAGDGTVAARPDESAPEPPPEAASTDIRGQDTSPEQVSAASEEQDASPKTLVSEADRDLKRLVPVRQRPRRRAAELILEEMVEPGERSPGDENHRPLSLLDALTRTVDRTYRLRIAHTYWDVAVALAAGRTSRLESRFLDELDSEIRAMSLRPAGEAEMARLRAAQADARAREAEAAWTSHEANGRLSELVALDPRAAPAVTSDRPHVGAYRTRFEQIFTRRATPPQARLLDRTLSVRHQEVEARALAVVAAEDALAAATEALFDGVVGLNEILDCHAALVEQRRAFLSAVRQYNHEIAQYAFIVVPDGMPPKTVVDMLIVPRNRDSTAATIRNKDQWTGSSVQHAGYNQAPAPPEATQIPERDATEVKEERQQTSAAADKPSLNSTNEEGAGSSSPRKRRDVLDSTAPSQPEMSGPLAWTPGSGEPSRDAIESRSQAVEASGGLYDGLIDVDPQTRLESLAEWLNWDDAAADADAEPVTLGQCLSWVSPLARRDVISAYWRAHRRATTYQCLAWRVDEYAKLSPALVTLRKGPAGAEAMLRLQAMRAAAAADLLKANAQWTTARFELTQACGRPPEARWLEPSSPPIATDASRIGEKRLAPPLSLRRDGEPGHGLQSLHAALLDRATAVVESDAAYRDAAQNARGDASAVGRLIKSLESQTARTLDFLAAVEAYNRVSGHAVINVN